MIKITVEMWPHGDKSRAYLLGEATITNVGGDAKHGNYVLHIFKKVRGRLAGHMHGGIWRGAALKEFPRQRLGVWDLMFRLFRLALTDRNPMPREPIPEIITNDQNPDSPPPNLDDLLGPEET